MMGLRALAIRKKDPPRDVAANEKSGTIPQQKEASPPPKDVGARA